MGASQFIQDACGKTAREAFQNGYDTACYDYGHRGYTGSMAEKDDFVEIPLPKGIDPKDNDAVDAFIEKLFSDCDERIDDKWGPAGCTKLYDDRWVFYGWASS